VAKKTKTSARAAARKMKDKWKAKEWYTIMAPDMFKGVEIAQTMADDPEHLMGRNTEVSLQDLTSDYSKTHIKLRFKVHSVEGSQAFTKFIGHDITSDYMRRQTRRKRSKIDAIVDVRTRDGYRMRIKPSAFTDRRIQSSQQRALRMNMTLLFQEAASKKTMSGLVSDMLSGTLPTAVFKSSLKIYPIKRVEVRKSTILSEPSPEQVEKFRKIEEEERERAERERGAEEAAAAKEGAIAEGVPATAPPVPTPGARGGLSADELPTKKELSRAFGGITGIGPTKALALWKAGMRNKDHLRALTAEELGMVESIGPKLAEKILGQLTAPEPDEEEE